VKCPGSTALSETTREPPGRDSNLEFLGNEAKALRLIRMFVMNGLCDILSFIKAYFFTCLTKCTTNRKGIQIKPLCAFTLAKYVMSRKTKSKLGGFSPQANYTDRATAACRRS
jgi:hypothetical protein